MWEKSKPIPYKLKSVLYFVIILLALATVTPVLAEYLGPNRTVTETSQTCQVILQRCSYVSSKKIYKYKSSGSWSCSNEGKPWLAYPSSGPSCTSSTVGATYWKKVNTPHEETVTYPPATIEGLLQNCSLNNGWCTTFPQLSLSAEEPVPDYDIIAIEGIWNEQNFACPDSDCSVPLAEGENELTYWALSSWGDSSTMGSMTVNVDSQLPVISGTFSGTTGSNGWYLGPVSFTGSAADTTSGLASFTCTLDGLALGSCSSITVNGEGPHMLVLTAVDNAGNSSIVTQNASIDSRPPTLSSSLQGLLGSNSWYNDAELHASATDPIPGSGVSVLEYNIDNIGWVAFPPSGVLDLPDGKHGVDIRVIDDAGHSVSSSKSYWLDSVAPEVLLNSQGTLGANNWYVTSLNLTASVNDDTSSVDKFEYTHNGSTWITYISPLVFGDGTHTISFWAQDKSGLVTQVDRLYQVDTVRPQIAGSISGIPGTNGWYVSDVTLSASVADPLPGSGVDAFTYILDNGIEMPYTNALTIADGIHTVRLNVQDKAGLTYFTEQSLKVDTIRPSLSVQTTLPSWVKGKVTLSGSSDDNGSGVSKVEISTNGGQSWQATIGTISWSYEWDTSGESNGSHTVIVRSTDHAGLTTEQVLTTAVDNQIPNISIPASWLQWQSITIDIWDNESGLSEARIEISDPSGRWPRRVIQLDSAQFPMSFKWDRRFGDDTIAPNGNYDVTVTAIDQIGNMSQQSASVRVLIDILPAGPTSTPQPYYRINPTPIFTSTPVPTVSSVATSTAEVSVFGEIQPTLQVTSTPEISPVPHVVPTQTGILEWLESVLIPHADSTDQITEVESSTNQPADSSFPGSDTSVLWGAAAAAMVGAVTSYALEEKRKKEEEIAARKAEAAAREERKSKIKEQKMEKLEAKWAQEKAWEEAREQEFAVRGASSKVDREEQRVVVAQIIARQQRIEEKKRAEEEKKKQERQAQLEAYLERQQKAAVPEPEANWWEKTKSFVKDNIVEPWNQYVYEPIIEPVTEKRNELLADTVSWLNSNVYQPYIAPKVDLEINKLKNDISWINDKIVQPWVIPFAKEVGGVVSDAGKWVNTKVIEPYIAPAIASAVESVMEDVAKFNENVLQPKILPALEKFNETFYQPYLAPIVDVVADGITEYKELVTEHIYEPIFAPIVNDINEYIVKPYVDPAVAWWDKTWDEYGEWVHNGLDAVGFIPGLGDIMDGMNGLIYLAEGRYLEAGISALAMLPVLGDLAKAGKFGLKVGTEIVEEAAEKIVKVVIEEGAEKATKELAENIVQKVAVETTEELSEKVVVETTEELVEKSAKETLETIVEKTTKETTEALSSKTVSESVEDVAEKTAKNTVEKISSESTEQAAKEAKDQLVQQALEHVDDETATLVRSVADKLGDDATSINKAIALIQKHGDGAIKALKAIDSKSATTVLKTVSSDILDDVVQQGSDAFAAFARWGEKELMENGPELALRATKDAGVLNAVKELIKSAPVDLKNLTESQKELIKQIAELSTHNADAKSLVLGQWFGLNDGFVQQAKNTLSTYYNPHPDVWNMLEKLGKENREEVAWLVNEQVIQNGITKGLPIEYTLNGILEKNIEGERAAIKAIFSGKSDETIMDLLQSVYMPARMKELQLLHKAGFELTFDSGSKSYILELVEGAPS